MREYFDDALKRKSPPTPENPGDVGQTMLAVAMTMSDDYGIFMSHWYGSLYVVIEGWRELKLNDPRINQLLLSPNVKLLKEFRNGTFHFRRNYFDDKLFAFQKSPDAVPWVRSLTDEFGDYFLRESAAESQAESRVRKR